MKDIYIKDLILNDEVTEFYLVKDSQLRFGSNNKQFLDLLLADKTGEIRAKKWDVSDVESVSLGSIHAGDLIKVKATVTEWNGTYQLRVMRIRRANDADNLDRTDFYKAAPEPPEEMYAYILSEANAIEDSELKAIALKYLEDNKDRLMYWPAASKNHHAEYAGLLWHMKRMLMTGVRLAEVYDILNKDLLVTGVIIHDMEKLEEMSSNEMGVVSDYTTEGILLGHLVQGAIKLGRVAKELGISEEKTLMLEHMSISHHYEPDFGSPKKPMFPEAEALHYLDMLDSKLFDMEEALDQTLPGGFSERVRTLDGRRIYKRTW